MISELSAADGAFGYDVVGSCGVSLTAKVHQKRRYTKTLSTNLTTLSVPVPVLTLTFPVREGQSWVRIRVALLTTPITICT